MTTSTVVRKNEYYDSVFLMRVADRIQSQPGVTQVAALMGTDANKQLLAEAGFDGADIARAGPNDLVVSVRSDGDASTLLAQLERWLSPETRPAVARAPSLDRALDGDPAANLVAISVPGEHAGGEARRALERGAHVFLFSDNVPLEQEIELKRYARERGLLLMGPDCGTAIVHGAAIGFANAVRRGHVGVAGPSGTGMQEVTTQLHRLGGGVSHALGTGSRDLSDAVGGVSTQVALEALESDPETNAIVIVAKPPGPKTLERIARAVAGRRKLVVACFLGTDPQRVSALGFEKVAGTLDEAAALALDTAPPASDLTAHVASERSGRARTQRYVRGLFAGGTFCYQAQQIFRDAGIASRSNAPLAGDMKLADVRRSVGHTFIDMGDDEFTRGRPHPMIDPRERRARLLAEARDPDVAVILLDFVLGYGASPDPAGGLAPAIRDAKEHARREGRALSVVASVCGTEDDPQGLDVQERVLTDAGAVVLESAAAAARFALELVR